MSKNKDSKQDTVENLSEEELNDKIEVNNEEEMKNTSTDIKVEETLDESKNSNKEILGDNVEENEKVEDGKNLVFLKRVLSGIIDQVISIAIALVLLLVFNLVLKIFGFYIVEREPIFAIIYVITNILYTPICNSSKLGKTIGLKINFK